MGNPTTKEALLKAIRDERKRFEKSFKGLSSSEMITAPAPGEWSVHDILAHIVAWEQRLIKWYETGMRGEKQVMPDWSNPGTVDAINYEIYKKNHDRWLKEIQKEFKSSHKQVLKIVKSIPEENMFVLSKYDWTGKATLADYIVSNTSEHYAEHTIMVEAIRQKLGK
jgi:hypothetical protein